MDRTTSASPPYIPVSSGKPTQRTPMRQVPPQTAASAEPGKKSIERNRTRSSPSLASNAAASSSASSSTTSLPRPVFPSARNGTYGTVEMPQRRSEMSEPSQQSSRPRTLSASSSGHSHGRHGVKSRPATPGTTPAASHHWSTPRVAPTPVLPPQVQYANATGSPPATSQKPSPRGIHPTTPPGLSNVTASAPPTATHPGRRPSLASPLPATPIIPSHLSKTAGRGAPAPLNLTGASPSASTPLRHHYHTTTGSMSSPHSPQPSPGHRPHSSTSTPTPPAPVHAAAVVSQAHAQFISVPRGTMNVPAGGSLPDSPSTRAMMKRLLAKPAPISPGPRSLGATSGSESDSQMRQRMRLRSESPHTRGRAVKTDGEEERYGHGRLPGEVSIEFDMDMEVLGRNIATMGQWSNRSNERIAPPLTPTSEGKEKEKEKRQRNVLRRRPSANNSSSSKSSTPPASSRTSTSQPPQRSAPQPIPSTSRGVHLPPLAQFAPLSISPIAKAAEPSAAENSAPKHGAPSRSPPKNMHRSVSASAALPTPSRIPRVHAALSALQSQHQPQSLHTPPHPHPHPPAHQRHQSQAPPQPPQTTLSPRHVYPRVHPQGARSPTTSQPSSRGSSNHSPRLSPIVNAHPTPAPTKTPSTPPPPSPSSAKRMSASSKPTPAASLVAAYQRQEREREARRLAAEKERAEMKREAQRITDNATFARGALRAGASLLETRAHSLPGTRRHSVSGLDALVEEKLQLRADEHGRARNVSGVGSALTVDSLASAQTADSGPRLFDDGSMSDFGSGGAGFDTIERMAKKEIAIRAPGAAEEENVTPYYTVLGSSSTRVAAGTSPEDGGWSFGEGNWQADVLGQRVTVVGGGIVKEKEGKVKESLGRTLSRKVSGRWKKQGGVVVGTVMDDEKERQGRMANRGRISMQERRKTGSTSRKEDAEDGQRSKMVHRRSLRLSIDKFSEFLDEQPPAVPLLAAHSSSRGTAPPTSAVSANFDSSDCDTESGKPEKKVSKLKKTEPSPTGSASSGGSRFWKLMRRISVGNLKDKHYETQSVPPPPVPALPKDLQASFSPLKPSSSNDSTRKNIRASELTKIPRSSSNSPTAAHVSQSMPHQRKASAPVMPSSQPQPANQPRPSTTTVSSSPVSSDMASSKFFHRPHSARSSTSSFEDEQPPPLPKRIPHHIVPPSELGKSHDDKAAIRPRLSRVVSLASNRSPYGSDDWAIVPSPSVELPSLPLPPPRRPLTAPSASADKGELQEDPKDIDRSESPTIPSFSNTAAVNAFPARRLSSTLSAKSRSNPSSPYPSSPASMLPPTALPTSTPPPPRPLRSAQRPNTIVTRAPTIEEQVPFPQPTIVINEISRGRRSESHAHHRRSSGGLSGTSTGTARPRRRSSSFGATTRSSIISSRRSLTPPPSVSGADTTVTFRELDGSRPRPPLTEREKAARWEDLLERSARAGGTLHLAGGARMLASDRWKSSRK